jgi:hypothetical protein
MRKLGQVCDSSHPLTGGDHETSLTQRVRGEAKLCATVVPTAVVVASTAARRLDISDPIRVACLLSAPISPRIIFQLNLTVPMTQC